MVIDPGFRIHTSNFQRPTSQTPSNFVAKLRKHLRTRRLSAITQPVGDRVLILTFSDGQYHLILEFFAGGNLILVDDNFKILALQRVVSEGANNQRVAVGVTYEFDQELLNNTDPLQVSRTPITKEQLQKWVASVSPDEDDDVNAISGGLNKKKTRRKAKLPSLKKLLYSNMSELSPVLLEQYLQKENIDGNASVKDIDFDDDTVSSIASAVKGSEDRVQELLDADLVTGFIACEKNPNWKKPDDSKQLIPGSIDPSDIEYLYDSFEPFEITVNEGRVETFEGYNLTVDRYFSTVESTRYSLRVNAQEQIAEKRLNAARNETKKRVDGLQEVQGRSILMGTALQASAGRVEEAIAAVKQLQDQGMDWKDMEHLIDLEKKKGNPVARMVASMNLEKNRITLILPNPEEEDSDSDSDDCDETDSEGESDESDSEEESKRASKSDSKSLKVEVDLDLTAYANANNYFDIKKVAAQKQEKTEKNSATALKSAEQKVKLDLKRSLAQEQHALRPMRQSFWFEKFWWFFSSDGYLVIGGKDAQQNEMVFKRHFRKGDVYVHAEIQGASTVIVKNHLGPTAPIPPSTLSQAGSLSICTSKAWDSKVLISAWWVEHGQVSKSAPSGEHLATGSFMIRGKKNFLPPTSLDVGLGIMWIVDEDSTAKYVQQRLEREKMILGDKADELKAAANMPDSQSESESDSESDSDDDMEFPDTEFNLKGDASGDEDSDESDEVEGLDGEDEDEDEEEEDEEEEEKKSEPKQTVAAPSKYDYEDKPEAPPSKIIQGLTANSTAFLPKKRLTAKERREARKAKADANSSINTPTGIEDSTSVEDVLKALTMKSGAGDSTDSSRDVTPGHDTPVSRSSTPALNDSTQSAAQTGPAPPKVRGKKGKLKKIAKKYADQDEEERKLRMDLLGSTKGAERAEQEAVEAAEKKRLEEERRAQRQERIKNQDIRRMLKEEGVAQYDDVDEEDARNQFDSFVARPQKADVVVGAIPMFAPWGALSKFKFKAKMVPGTVKKGKAVKEIVHKMVSAKTDPTMQDTDIPWPNEVDIIGGLKDTELVQPVAVGRVRLVLAGAMSSLGPASKTKGGKNRGRKKR